MIASVGHHSDRTLLDDVAAVSCSTPPTPPRRRWGSTADGRARRPWLPPCACATTAAGRSYPGPGTLTILSRAPAGRLERQRGLVHQRLRELRAGARRRLGDERALAHRRGVVLERKASSTLLDCRQRRPRELEQLGLALAGHDPQRTLERGYALAFSRAGEPLSDVHAARAAASCDCASPRASWTPRCAEP